MDEWFCADLKSLFDAKNKFDDSYVDCQFGAIEKDGDYYDFGTTGMPRLCCDGEQCKLIKVENGVVTLLSDGNSYEDNVEDYYFKFTLDEARIAGINLLSVGINYEDLEKIWGIVNHQEYEDEETGLWIDFGEVSCACLGGWQITLNDTIHEISANGVMVCKINYKLQSSKWLLPASVLGIDKNKTLQILGAIDFKEE